MVKGYSESAEYLGDLIIGDSKLKETYFSQCAIYTEMHWN
mgnify:CR=1 FL=1